MSAGLRDRFGLLTTRAPHGALPRQRTLRATLDWSHDLLPETERAVVFCGAWPSSPAASPSIPPPLSWPMPGLMRRWWQIASPILLRNR